MKIIRYLLFIILVSGLILTTPVFSQTATADSLRQGIEAKNAELQKILEERAKIEKQLEETGERKDSLQKELQTINYTINQLNLSIKANQVALQKLSLEIESLDDEIKRVETVIDNKKETIGKLMVELQQKDQENFLMILLKNQSLAESISEVQSIATLQNDLAASAEELRVAQQDMIQKSKEKQAKQKQKEVEQVSLVSRQQIVQDQKSSKNRLLSQTKNQEKIYQQQAAELKKLQDEVSAEIEKFEKELRKTIDPNLLPIPRPGVLLWPVPGGRETQGYGRTPFAIKTYKSQYHNGIDIGRFLGAEVVAAEDGTVINAGDQDKFCYRGAYGKFIVIKHDNGLTTLYAHLSKYLVSVGQRVERGEVVAYMGRTGWATGPHLHFTVFATQTLTPARPGLPEGTQASRVCGPMPVGGDIDPHKYL